MELPYIDGLEAYDVVEGDNALLLLARAAVTLEAPPTAEVAALTVLGASPAAAATAEPTPLAGGTDVLTRLPARSQGFGGAEAVACMKTR
mmetsp:Transcript_27740/g.56129  ORF Transcript_27740/g.56129 Transcript_27740/m.56129 type:complete len:90 (+) Transcript_27740:653-922(+)